MKKVISIALTEARMSCRGWRFWLLLMLIAGFSLFARNDFISHVENGFYLHSAYSFQHPSFWLMFAVSMLGTASLALDAVGRLRRTGMDKILFPLPVDSFQLYAGLYLGVMLVIVPLSFVGIYSLAVWQAIYGHAAVVWQPYWVAYLYLVLPSLVPVTALVMTLRTLFKHDFATLLLSLAGLALVGYFREALGVFINFADVAMLLVNASPNLGVLINHGHYFVPMLVHMLFAFVLLSVAPLYLRRQEPQRTIAPRAGSQVFGIRTLLQSFDHVRFDKHLGNTAYAALFAALALFGLGSAQAFNHYLDYAETTRQQAQYTRLLNTADLKTPPVDVVSVNARVEPNENYSSVAIESEIIFDALEAVETLNFELADRYKLSEVFVNGSPVTFEKSGALVQVRLDEALPANGGHKARFIYEGAPKNLHVRYSALADSWLPMPWHLTRAQHQDEWIDSAASDYYEGSIALHLKPGQQGAFAGQLVNADTSNSKRVERWRTFTEVNEMVIHWGAYGSYDLEKEGYRARFYHLPNHDYQAAIYFEENREQEEYVREKLGDLPFEQLTIIERPYEYPHQVFSMERVSNNNTEKRDYVYNEASSMMPALINVRENRIGYLHENMWLRERFDHNPADIPFYQQVPEVVERLHDQFYKRLISVYFDHSLQPAGDYAFWLRDHLSNYASSLLEQNRWRRRDELNFDIGTGPEFPISVARRDNLLALHQNGSYPELLERRGEGLFRMLHHLLGDENWWKMMQTIFRDYRFDELTAEEFIGIAETFYGDSLDWFEEQWLKGTVLPEYQILQAEAEIVENERDMDVVYNLAIRVKNHGTGRMAVPVFIETEMDYIFRDLWLDSGEEGVLRMTVPNRPIFTVIDPERWVVQEPYYDPNRKRRQHSESRIYIRGDDSARGGIVKRGRGRGRW